MGPVGRAWGLRKWAKVHMEGEGEHGVGVKA